MIKLQDSISVWVLIVPLTAFVILIGTLGASLLLLLLTLVTAKLNITFYQSALLFAGLVIMLFLGGYLYQKAHAG